MAMDLVSALAMFALVSYLRFGSRWGETWRAVEIEAPALGLGYAIGWVASLWFLGLYRLRARWFMRAEVVDIAKATLLLAVTIFATLFLLKLPDVSRLFLFALLPAQALLTLASRVVLRRWFRVLRRRGASARYLLVVGTGSEAQSFADRVEAHPDLALQVIGHLRVGEEPEGDPGRPIIGDLDDLEAILHERVVDEVAVCLSPALVALIDPITRLCEDEGKIVRIPVSSIGLPLRDGHLEDFEGTTVLSLVYGPDRALALGLKRLLDISLASVAIVILSPVMLFVGLAIRLRDGPPVLFRQGRIGLHGRPFTLLKFRTMVPGAEEQLGELAAQNEVRGRAFKLTRDPRLTATGAFLRRTSADELPQLWNVLRGEMSLVGPRPPLPAEVAGYDVWHRRRLSMKPGITGLWQVKARRETDFDRWVEMDLDYIDRWSLWLDLSILLRTIPAVLLQQGR